MQFVRLSLLILCAFCFTLGCESPSPLQVASTIVDAKSVGSDDLATVRIDTPLGLCTGALIARCVVLTAKHCVQPVSIQQTLLPETLFVRVGNGPENFDTTVGVKEVLTTPGFFSTAQELEFGEDIAALILAEDIDDVEPYSLRRGRLDDLLFRSVVGVGYGIQEEGGDSGTKGQNRSVITDVREDFVATPALACRGDSGGPLRSLSRELLGINSFSNDQCGQGINGYTRIDRHAALIDAALEKCDACNPEEPAGCNEEKTECDPLRPFAGCESGFFCAPSSGCGGTCEERGSQEKAIGEGCETHGECASLRCENNGDDEGVCTTPCQVDTGMCPVGETCILDGSECGYCQAFAEDEPSSTANQRSSIGEPCAGNDSCDSELCILDRGRSYCATHCEDDEACPTRFHCQEGQCVRGIRGGVGSPCFLSNGDCQEAHVCVEQGESSYCSRACSEQAPCPTGFSCRDTEEAGLSSNADIEATHCVPDLSPMGTLCESDEECLTRLCTEVTEDESRCSMHCGVDLACPPGFECSRTGNVSNCVPTTSFDVGGRGCTISQPSGRGGDSSLRNVLGLLWALLALAWLRSTHARVFSQTESARSRSR